MLTVAVLISGAGSNLRALLEAAAAPDFPARVVAVGADREAEGFAHAEHFGIPTFLVPFRSFATREEWGAELGEQLAVWNPDLVVLSGMMRLLPADLVAAWEPRIINTHPAYLPEFPVRTVCATRSPRASSRRGRASSSSTPASTPVRSSPRSASPCSPATTKTASTSASSPSNADC